MLTPMHVMGFETFKKQGRIPISGEAQAQELLEHFHVSRHFAVFISHMWCQAEAGHANLHGG